MSPNAQAPAARGLALAGYALLALTLVLGFPLLLALALHLTTADRVRGSVYESHFAWQRRTVEWALLTGVPGGVLLALGPALGPVLVPLGSLLLLVAIVWIVYRTLRGIVHWSQGLPAPGHSAPA